MAVEYSTDICTRLIEQFKRLSLHRPMRIGRYEPGTELSYEIKTINRPCDARVKLVIDRFVGGGFAGQVYKITITDIQTPLASSQLPLAVGGQYAMKILIPPGGFSRLFRNLLYAIGFQGSFQPQVNPSAARAGALWQKFIRRAAEIKFGDENAVKNIYATFIDDNLGSCGEISDWVDGRTWRLEVDENLDTQSRWFKHKKFNASRLGSPEYRAKYLFMRDFVKMLDELGAYEFARQYEWSTWKSQPNVLKRKDCDNDPAAGLMAIDFRAGLTLLPFLPMSPGDFMLILKGIARGSLVQFDRGDIRKLEKFVKAHQSDFADMAEMLDELKRCEEIYRNSIPDITHNHIRLLTSAKLRHTILDSAVTSWRVRNIIDSVSLPDRPAGSFGRRIMISLLCLISLVPLFGHAIIKFFFHADWRKHYLSLFNPAYLDRAIRGIMIEKAVRWHRAARVNAAKAGKIAGSFSLFLLHFLLSLIPMAGLHRILTDLQFVRERLFNLIVFPWKLYFNSALRKQWITQMIEDGKRKHIISDTDAGIILSQLDEPYIQRYLISLVVHLLTLPVTQIVSFTWAAVHYYLTGDELGAAAIVVIFQVIPISPGSICRGLWAVFLACYDRNFKDYNIAVFMSFFKYIGYLAFPIQMTYRYPTLARFMAGHWATEAVHIVPVFGEHGAFLEHWVYNAFYNWPLTIRRRAVERMKARANQPARYWHVPVLAILAAVALAYIEQLFVKNFNIWPCFPNAGHFRWVLLIVALTSGALVTVLAGGTAMGKRVLSGTVCGVLTGLLFGIFSELAGYPEKIALQTIWRIFFLAILTTLGVIITELKLPAPKQILEGTSHEA